MKKVFELIAIIMLLFYGSQTIRADRYDTEITSAYEFGEWIMSDTLTMSMNLSEQAANLEVNIVESPDGKIKVYSWISGGGTSPCWATITQYRNSKGRVKSFWGMPIMNNADCTIINILVADNIGEAPVYFFEVGAKVSGAQWERYLCPSVLKGDKFVKGPKFKDKEGRQESIDISHIYYDSWDFKVDVGEGWDWKYSYHPESKQLYIQYVDDDMDITDRYQVYEFDGTDFTFIGIKGSPYLHSSLQNYVSLIKLFKTDMNLVRIDDMPDGSYRMSIWYTPFIADQRKTPSLVVDGGGYDSGLDRYIFPLSDSLKYEIDVTEPALALFNGEKMVYCDKNWNQINYYSYLVEALISHMNTIFNNGEKPSDIYITEDHVIIIYSLPGDQFKYVSWYRPSVFEKIDTTPNIILENGRIIDGYYVFKNGSYSYEIPIALYDSYISIKYGTEISRKEMIINSYSPDDIPRLIDSLEGY